MGYTVRVPHVHRGITQGMKGLTYKAVLHLLTAALIGCTVQGYAQAPDGTSPAQLNLSLESAIALAVRNNRELINAQLERVSERFTLRIAENKFRPHVTVGSRFELSLIHI